MTNNNNKKDTTLQPTIKQTIMECKLKQRCPNKTDPLYNCWSQDCEGWIHSNCCDALLNKFEIKTEDRPSPDAKNDADEPVVFCKKGCYTKWKQQEDRKKREEKKKAKEKEKEEKDKDKKKFVPWDEDGTLEALMTWLTTEPNYADYCGATHNKGKPKKAYHKEIAEFIKKECPDSDRTPRDVDNKIFRLETAFRLAADWLGNTGAGLPNPGDVEAGIKARCSLYHELEPVMGDRPNAKPLGTSDELDLSVSSSDSEEGSKGEADTAVLSSMNNAPDSTPRSTDGDKSSSDSQKKLGSSAKRLISSTAKAPKPKEKKPRSNDKKGVDDFMSFYGEGMQAFREREVQAKEKEAAGSLLVAQALSEKHKKETSILSIEEKAKLLLTRKKLEDEGIAQDQIDLMLPLPTQKE